MFGEKEKEEGSRAPGIELKALPNEVGGLSHWYLQLVSPHIWSS